MKDSTLLKLIKNLSNYDRKQWLVYIQSPFFNTNETVTKLCSAIYKDLKKDKLQELEKYISIAYKNKKHTYAQMRKLISDSIILTEGYILYQFKERKNYQDKLELAKILRQQFDGVRYEYHINKLKKNADQFKNDLTLNILLNSESDDYLFSNNNFSHHEILFSNASLITQKSLQESLELACEIQNRIQMFNIEFENSWEENIVEYIKKHPTILQENIAVNVYYNIYLTITTDRGLKNYKTLKKLIEKEETSFSNKRLEFIYYYLSNFLLRKINAGESEYEEEALLAYLKIIDKEFIYQQNYLPDSVYKNVVTLAIRTKKFDFAYKFIEEKVNLLQPDLAENAYNYNLANYYYHSQNHNKAIQHLVSVQFTNSNYNLGSKALLLKIYFESDEDEALDHLINAFKVYLQRNKLIANKKHKRYYNLFRLTAKLSKINRGLPYNTKEKNKALIESLKGQIEKSKAIVSKNWLLTQLEALKV